MNEYKDNALKNTDDGNRFQLLIADLDNLRKDNQKKTTAIRKFEIQKSELSEKLAIERASRAALQKTNSDLALQLEKQTNARNSADAYNFNLTNQVLNLQQDYRSLETQSSLLWTEKNTLLKE